MLHALGYWRPSLAAFPDRAAERELAEDAGAAQERSGRLRQGDRRGAPGVGRLHARLRGYDDEAIAAVDKFRADKKLNYQGNPPGLVDQRFVDALKAAYLEKRKTGR